ncbi:MAG TPA: thioredoxin [Bacteroidales bacterium]|nr:MAG: thioredoxin [Bacteroidetes bacterium GWF2_33_38]OFY85997.1 MAG: thioredoxin [Bacteroidetes bacterium RIFOXYA2_FULL_33_7]HBF88938.1 thioredoxin [Bacteroidales bacterium]
MKYLFLLLVFISVEGFKTNAQVIENVDAVKFKQLVDSGEGIILDVRTPGEVARGHIKGATAINIGEQSFATKVNLLQKEKPIYVYCLTGSRSVYAAKYMAQVGFKKIYNLQLGIVEWNKYGYPVEKDEATVASTSVQYNEYSFSKLIESNKLVLIDFHAIWCAPCKKMAPDIDKLKVDYKGKAEIVKVDIEANESIAKLYNVVSVPTLILFKNGKQVWSKSGAMNYDELSSIIKQYL